MVGLTVSFGAALILLGVVSYAATGAASVTALIPAFFGAPILLAGVAMTRWPAGALYAACAPASWRSPRCAGCSA